jgi:hypothetical protein
MDRLRRRFFSSFSSLPSEPVDLCLLVGTAFFGTGLQPRGCTKQLIRVEVGRPFAWTSRLQARWPAPSKIMRSPRRLFKTTRSRSPERSEFGPGSTRGQPRGKIVNVRAYEDAHVHGPCMQVDACVESVLLVVESHHGLPGWVGA